MSTVRLQQELSYKEAVRVLGFEPGALVSPHLPAFRDVEEKLNELIKTTKDEELKTNFREELGRLNEALRVVEEGAGNHEPPARRKGMGARMVVSLVFVAVLVGAAWWANRMVVDERRKGVQREVESLSVDGRIAVENRRWPEAKEIFGKIDEIDPGSARARDGFRSIAEGQEAVRRQKVGFLVGSVRAGIEQRDWDEVETVIGELREMVPDHEEIAGFLKQVAEGRTFDRIVGVLEGAEEAVRDEEWEVLATRTKELGDLAPDHAQLPRLRELAANGMKLLEARRMKARSLYEQAAALDAGTFSAEALDYLREAIRLSDDAEIAALYEKMSRYARVLEVPGDFETIGAALKEARANDKIRVAAGLYKEALVLRSAVDLEGAGPKKTIVTVDGGEASVILIGKEAKGSRVAGFRFRQEGIVLEDERFPVVAIEGESVNLEDCRVDGGSGHGIAVLSGGSARLRNVEVFKSGWDGLAVYGDDSHAVVEDSRFEANLHHGIDVWGGGSVEVRKSRCTLNGLTGIVLMATDRKSLVQQCILDRNREVGMVLANGAHGVLRSNRAESNLLGGFLVEGEATNATLEGNVAEKNGEMGIVIDKRSTLVAFKENTAEGNLGEQIQLKAELPDEVIAPPPALENPAIPVAPPPAPKPE